MPFKDTLHETYVALSANRVRSGLTILGIVIGISSVIAMVSIGNGAQASINSSIESIGSNLIEIMPGAQRSFGYGASAGRGSAQTLTQEDADAIASQVPNIQSVASEISGRDQIVARGTNTNTTVDGVSSSYPTIRNVQIAEGVFFTDAQNQSLAKVAVIGPTVAADLFADGSDPVGQQVTIKGVPFTVIGTTVAKGGSGFASPDDMIYVPLQTAAHYLTGSPYLTSIDVQASNAQTMTQVQNDITSLLLARHRINNPQQADFNVLNQADILATAGSITQTFTLLLAAVAGISLIVGGIGIMNMMLTSVTERTREIGLRKAIGATKRDISLQFLTEAVALTLIGGGVGVALGWGICALASTSGLIATQVSLSSVALAFGVSAGIGIIFGYYPARRAARLSPIEALRYE